MKTVQRMKKQTWLAWLAFAGVFGVCALNADAALTIANGDFETGAGNNIDDVTGWSDFNDGSFYHGTWQTDNGGITPNATCVSILGSFDNSGANNTTMSADPLAGSYLYQSIGTADGTNTLELSFDWGVPNDDPGGRSVGLSVAVYAYDGVGTFADGDNVDIRAAYTNSGSGLTLLDSASYSMTSTGVDGLISNVVVNLDLTGAGSQELFLNFNNYRPGSTESWTALDNVYIASSLPPFETIQVSPTGTGVTNPVTLEAVVVDLGTTFSNATMYLDGGSVSATTTNNESTNIITYAAPTFGAGTTHTGLVVVTGMDASVVSNEWTFTMGGDPGFGIYISTTTNNPATGVDDISQFVGAQSDSNNCNTIINTNSADMGAWNDASTYVAYDKESSQGQLFTTGSGPGYELSSVWVRHVAYNSTYGNGTFANLQLNDVLTLRIVDPSLADTAGFVVHSEVLNVISNSLNSAGTLGTALWIEFRLQNPVALSGSTQYGFDITSYNDAFDSYFELSGISTNQIGGGSAYTTGSKAALNTGTLQSGDRTFMIALTQVGPTVTPNITAFTVSGGSATLMWDSETGVNYGVMHKIALPGGSWTEVTNVAGAGASTMATVPAAASAEFFQIEGN